MAFVGIFLGRARGTGTGAGEGGGTGGEGFVFLERKEGTSIELSAFVKDGGRFVVLSDCDDVDCVVLLLLLLLLSL
jgi:hypothetical protein